MKRFLSSDVRAAMVVFVASCACYLPSVATHVSWTDSGELAASAVAFGIPHPTGYPLLSILARVWLLLPLPASPVTNLNIMSSVIVAAAAAVLTLVLARLLASSTPSSERSGALVTLRDRAIAMFGGAVAASSATIWDQAVSYEVYALHLLLLACILYSALLLSKEIGSGTVGWERRWVMLAFVVGLGFTNHMSTILLIPPLALVLWRARLGSVVRTRQILLATGAGGLALTLYLVLIVRAAANPPLSWGGTDTIEGLLRHVSGKQYQVWMFSSGEVFRRNVTRFIARFPVEFAWPTILLMAAGVRWMLKESRTASLLAASLFVSTLLYSANYDIFDIEPYFLGAFVSAVVPCVFGLRALVRWSARMRGGPVVLAVLTFVLVGWQSFRSAALAGSVHTPAVEAFSRSVLGGVDAHAVIITGRWDYLYSPALYLQTVEGVRPDVKLIDHSLLHDRSWYVQQLSRRTRDWGGAVEARANAFLAELRTFERGEPYEPAVIGLRWQNYWTGLLEEAAARGPVYLDVRMAGEVPAGWEVVPSGFLLRVAPKGTSLWHSDLPEIPMISGQESVVQQDLRSYCVTVFTMYARYLAARGELALADSARSRAVALGVLPPR